MTDSWQAKNLGELLAEPYQHRDWGPWRLDREAFVVFLPLAGNATDDHRQGFRCYVDLERCLDSADVLDWIAQVGKKNYADDAVLAGLVRALDDVLDVQANLCSFGRHKTITAEQARALAVHAAVRIGKSVEWGLDNRP